MVEIDGLALDEGCGRDQFVGRPPIEPETAFDQAVKLALFGIGGFASNAVAARRYPVSSRPRGSWAGETTSAMNWRSPSSINDL
jgi:hypothetical protein